MFHPDEKISREIKGLQVEVLFHTVQKWRNCKLKKAYKMTSGRFDLGSCQKPGSYIWCRYHAFFFFAKPLVPVPGL